MTAELTRPPTFRVFRGYGPILAFSLVFTLVAAFVPTTEPQVVVADGGARPGGGRTAEVVDPDGGGGRRPEGTKAAAGGTERGTEVSLPPGEVSLCSDGRDLQVPGDTYSPPCVEFSGDNGGATTRGVTRDEIVVSFRVTDEPSFQDALAQLSGADIVDSPEDMKRTTAALAEYFNQRFEFYGRKLKLAFYDGKGSIQAEILGGGQEEAQQDARHVAREIKAFADVTALTPPFTDALSREKVLNIGAPYMSRAWFSEQAPYAWSGLPDCSIVVETAAYYGFKRLYFRSAQWAGGDLQGRPRKFGTISPENTVYVQCVDDGDAVLRELGVPEDQMPMRLAYQLNLATMSNQATNLIAKVKDAGITTIFAGFDPVMAIFLTGKAVEQNYFPEWVVGGVALQDLDVLAQLFDQESWSRAFGVSYLGEFQPARASYGYHAYKAVRDDEPAFAVDLLYYQLYMLAIGIQLAGPELTPHTYAEGMFLYPGGNGPAGTWHFAPGDLTPADDAREIWWDPDRLSPQNNEPGTYVETAPGTRYRPEAWPGEEPRVFQ